MEYLIRILQNYHFQGACIALLSGLLGPVMDCTTDEHSKKEDKKQYRILIIGKTGNGKSSIANIILGKKAFHVGCTMASTTLQVQSDQSESDDCVITVFDTPDPANTDLAHTKLKEEIKKWKKLNPSAILLAVRCDVRYTAEEFAIYKSIKAAWADKSFVKRLMVVFTFKDRQDTDLDEELKTVCPELKKVLKDSGHTYVAFNNLASKDAAKQQIKELLSKIDKMNEIHVPRKSSVLTITSCLSALAFAITVLFQKKQPNRPRYILIAALVFALPPALVAMYQRYNGL